MSTPYIGEIRTVGFNFVPVNWLACNGQTLPIAQYQALYALLGTTYGGDGQTTFKVPDMRSRVALHAGTGPGLSNYALGQTGGAEEVTLITNQLPTHTHPYSLPLAASSGGTLSDNPAGNLPSATSSNSYAGASQSGKSLASNAVTATTSVFGGNQPHANTQPALALNFIICAEGIFPPRQ